MISALLLKISQGTASLTIGFTVAVSSLKASPKLKLHSDIDMVKSGLILLKLTKALRSGAACHLCAVHATS